MFRKLFAALCIVGLMAASTPVYAEYDEEVDESAVVFDVLLVRPLGVVALAIGTGVFLVSLPFTVPTWSVDRAADTLIVKPFEYTFVRPIGEIPD